ncbi:uncharacterized protein ASCRUDRAFT_94559 [Ascoidea rubescens DSM 1968]|uniref:Uncharacterized protein n=1 Tax=Ascoidea rubescens DSM 1968 TaxID=1344418 RepID=A0A1D2VP01_9ASCO|nr:hypothetical protein ASCRUDRAFT_94559 [Ascoidea rubescens DSM 1968]ODV63333.1 hypothetical protein ASCRUDRAFT_94559 [Ascoidea rubescens DSM 1968]
MECHRRNTPPERRRKTSKEGCMLRISDTWSKTKQRVVSSNYCCCNVLQVNQ